MNTFCPFCSDEIKENAFMSSQHFLAIYNNAPVLPGHSLVIPKRHVESILSLDEQELSEFISFSRLVTRVILKAFSAKSFNWTIQEGLSAGQTVAHLHFHIIPRYDNDLPHPGDWYPLLKKQQESGHIDSELREKVNKKDLIVITQQLKDVARSLTKA